MGAENQFLGYRNVNFKWHSHVGTLPAIKSEPTRLHVMTHCRKGITYRSSRLDISPILGDNAVMEFSSITLCNH